MNSRLLRRCLALVLAMIASSANGQAAQVPTGTITGTVQDAQGLAIEGATVTLMHEGTEISQTGESTSRGSFQFNQINFGTYRIEVSKADFKTSVVTGIKLDASTQYSVPPIGLEVGTVNEQVIVEAGADLVRTAGAEITTTVEKTQIEGLPILDRNPLRLLSLQAGVNQNRRTATVINGQQQSFGNVTLDGINIQDNYIRANALDYTPNLLFIGQAGEFTTTTQNAGPQAGLGSSQISIVTPAGTNNWHGEAFWYYRTGAWAANDWFNNANGNPKANLLQNQGGGNLGGPVVKNKLFVYGAYELLRLRQQNPVNTIVLTGPARAGIFQWRDLESGALRSLDMISYLQGFDVDVSLDPVMAAILNRVPTSINNPSLTGTDGLNTGGYSFNQRSDTTRDNISLRADWNPASRHLFTGTYAWNRLVADRPGATLGVLDSYDPFPAVFNDEATNFLSTAWRWSARPNFTNEVRFGFNLAPVNFLTTQQFGAATISGTLFNNPDLNVFPSSRSTHTWSWQDNAAWTRGSHAFVFGVQAQRVSIFARNYANTIPDLAIGDFYSFAALGQGDFAGLGGISSADLATANALLSSVAGIFYQQTQTFNVTSRTSGYVPGAPATQNFRVNNFSFYGGDSWKARPNLTVTYGLRWEYFGPLDERDGLLMLPVVPAGQTAVQTLLSDATLDFAGGGSGRRPYGRDRNNFAPNIGVAWDPFGDGKTSVRAGYSVNFVNDELVAAPFNAAQVNPGVSTPAGPSFLDARVSDPGVIPVPPISETFSENWINLYNFNTGLNFGYAIDPNLRTPYVQQWNLTLQRETAWNTSVSVSYQGNKGTKLYRAIDLNQVVIRPNGFLEAFNVARSNGFLALAANPAGGFDPNFDDSIPGSQPVDYFDDNFLFGSLFNFPGFDQIIRQYLQQGAAGNLADLYHSIGADSSYLYQLFFGTDAPVALAPNQYLRAADLLTNYSNSTYHAAIIEVRRRSRQGLYFQGNYAFSKVLTDFSADTSVFSDRFFPLLDNANPRLERARAAFDLTHAFKANFVYELPFGSGHRLAPSSGLLDRMVSGWQVSSIYTWQSGSPFSIVSNRGTLNREGRSEGTNTVSTTMSVAEIRSSLGRFRGPNGEVWMIDPKFIGPDSRGVGPDVAVTCTPLVPGGFCNPDPGTAGNLPRNAFNNPSFFNWDFGVSKRFAVTEGKSLEYRAEIFNVLNHPTFAVGNVGAGLTDMNINDLNFGTSNSTLSTPRRIQMALRFIF